MRPNSYQVLLDSFSSCAVKLDILNQLWLKLCLKIFNPVMVQGRIVLACDGIKAPREGRRMPAVKHCHQSSTNNSKPEFIMAHCMLRTAADYTGGRKSLDGSDELEEHLEALSELDMRNAIRTHERTDSVFKADVMMDVNVADLEDDCETPAAHFTYDEWDESRRAYKKDWCKVSVSQAPERVPVDEAAKYIDDALMKNQRQVRELLLMFEKIQAERRWRNRQIDGPGRIDDHPNHPRLEPSGGLFNALGCCRLGAGPGRCNLQNSQKNFRCEYLQSEYAVEKLCR